MIQLDRHPRFRQSPCRVARQAMMDIGREEQ